MPERKISTVLKINLIQPEALIIKQHILYFKDFLSVLYCCYWWCRHKEIKNTYEWQLNWSGVALYTRTQVWQLGFRIACYGIILFHGKNKDYTTLLVSFVFNNQTFFELSNYLILFLLFYGKRGGTLTPMNNIHVSVFIYTYHQLFFFLSFVPDCENKMFDKLQIDEQYPFYGMLNYNNFYYSKIVLVDSESTAAGYVTLTRLHLLFSHFSTVYFQEHFLGSMMLCNPRPRIHRQRVWSECHPSTWLSLVSKIFFQHH